MPDLERRAVVRFGLSLSEFWDSTPRELDILMEQGAYRMESGMNEVRHIMAAIANSVPRKTPKVFSPRDMMKLPLIDGVKTLEDYKTEQQQVDEALIKLKEKYKKNG